MIEISNICFAAAGADGPSAEQSFVPSADEPTLPAPPRPMNSSPLPMNPPLHESSAHADQSAASADESAWASD